MTTWKKSLAIGTAAFLLGSGAAWAAEPVATGATYAENAANAPMPLPLTEEEVSAQQLADAEYMALLWMRTSAEYRALCYQGYNAALMAIDRAQANPTGRSGKPLAIVLDCDETVTDNTRAMAASVAAGSGRFDALWWRATVHEGRSEALPGAALPSSTSATAGAKSTTSRPSRTSRHSASPPWTRSTFSSWRIGHRATSSRALTRSPQTTMSSSTWATMRAICRSARRARVPRSAAPSSTMHAPTSARATSYSRTPLTARGSARCQRNT